MSKETGVAAVSAANIASAPANTEMLARGLGGVAGYLSNAEDVRLTKVIPNVQGYGTLTNKFGIGVDGKKKIASAITKIGVGSGFPLHTAFQVGDFVAYHNTAGNWIIKNLGGTSRAGDFIRIPSPSGYDAIFYNSYLGVGVTAITAPGQLYEVGDILSSLLQQPNNTSAGVTIRVDEVSASGAVLDFTVTGDASWDQGQEISFSTNNTNGTGLKLIKSTGTAQYLQYDTRNELINVETENNELTVEIRQDPTTEPNSTLYFVEVFSNGQIAYASEKIDQPIVAGDLVTMTINSSEIKATIASAVPNAVGGYTGIAQADTTGTTIAPTTGSLKNETGNIRPVANPWQYSEINIKGIDTPSFDVTLKCQDIEHITATKTLFGIKYKGKPDGNNVAFIAGEKYTITVTPRQHTSEFYIQAVTTAQGVGYSTPLNFGNITRFQYDNVPRRPQVTSETPIRGEALYPFNYANRNSSNVISGTVNSLYWSSGFLSFAMDATSVGSDWENNATITIQSSGGTNTYNLSGANRLVFANTILWIIPAAVSPIPATGYIKVTID